jgi:hypothetical protein
MIAKHLSAKKTLSEETLLRKESKIWDNFQNISQCSIHHSKNTWLPKWTNTKIKRFATSISKKNSKSLFKLNTKIKLHKHIFSKELINEKSWRHKLRSWKKEDVGTSIPSLTQKNLIKVLISFQILLMKNSSVIILRKTSRFRWNISILTCRMSPNLNFSWLKILTN